MDGNQRDSLVIARVGLSSSALVCTIMCLPRSSCKPQSLRCRTSSEPPGISDEAGSLSQRWWRPASPERWRATIFEMLTTVPVLSVSLTGLHGSIREESHFCLLGGEGKTLQDCWRCPPGHLWQYPLRNCDPVGPAPDPLAPCCGGSPLDRTKTESFPSYQWSHEHQHAQKFLCRSRAVMFGLVIQCRWTNWTLRRIFGRGANVNCRVLNCIPMNWKSWLGVRSDFS